LKLILAQILFHKMIFFLSTLNYMTIQNEYLLSQKFNNINHNSYWKWLWLKFYAHSCDMIGSTKVGDIILDTKYNNTSKPYLTIGQNMILAFWANAKRLFLPKFHVNPNMVLFYLYNYHAVCFSTSNNGLEIQI
jgi:hypothetical protein